MPQRAALKPETASMTKPTILTVDDDPMVSAAITRDLRSRYGADYRVVRGDVGRRGARRCWPSSPCATSRSR